MYICTCVCVCVCVCVCSFMKKPFIGKALKPCVIKYQMNNIARARADACVYVCVCVCKIPEKKIRPSDFS